MLGFGFVQFSKAQAVERGNRAGTHGKYIAMNTPYTRSRALKRLNSTRVVVAFNFKNNPIAIANIH